jgi:hypothetical protein
MEARGRMRPAKGPDTEAGPGTTLPVTTGREEASLPVSLRPVPYPYRAMLAICSDLDNTLNGRVYLESMRFLNTTESTSMGRGVGLEVGNSIYFDMPPGHFSYWNSDDAGREAVCALIGSGHVDCLHSFGDLAATRAHADRALDELSRRGLRLEVWVDHARAPSNFGRDIMRGQGDVPGSPAYHADLTCAFGIRYAWMGRVTSVIGQEAPRSLRGIYRWDHPAASAKTLLTEWAKGALGSCGYGKYAIHAPNRLLRVTPLRDGSVIKEFTRSNFYWGGVGRGATADGIAEVLNTEALDLLVERGGSLILYTHLGKSRTPASPFGEPTRSALDRLSGYESEGNILVTTTRRMLGFHDAMARVEFRMSVTGRGGITTISLGTRGPGGSSEITPGDLQGLTFYVPDPEKTRLLVDGEEGPALRRNGPDHTGRKSVSIPWRRLEFPGT